MRRDLRPMADTTFDLVVVGAGIYGAIAAWDAAQRGLSVALLDRADFGSGTTFNSLKTLHGGLRSLQALNLRQMRLFIRERRALARIAPHLVRVLPCVVPTYGDLRRSGAVMKIALFLNDLVARDRNEGLDDPRTHIPTSRIVSREECLALNPIIDPDGVTAGAVWHDYQMTSADRMTLAFVRSACTAGALAANYLGVTRLLSRDARVEGVSVRDGLTGVTFDVRARVVLNAAGPWATSLLDGLPGTTAAVPAPALSRAMNLVTRPLESSIACGGLAGGRFLFVVPWQGASILGTSHDPYDGGPDLRVTRAHVEALLREARAAFPRANLSYADIRLLHRGLLPMVSAATDGQVTLLRESVVVDCRAHGIEGLVSIFGVRFTTARQTAQDAVDAVFRGLGYSLPPQCRTDRVAIDGGQLSTLDALVRETASAPSNPPDDVVRRLVSAYGARANEVVSLACSSGLANPLSAECAVMAAEVVYAIRSEAAVHLADAVVRRTGAGAAGHPGAAALARAAELMKGELGWSDEQRRQEIADVETFYKLPE
jgi:glycerol-3-phosphate dehydrogenase